jgi:hypothetical protein
VFAKALRQHVRGIAFVFDEQNPHRRLWSAS